MQIDNNNWMPPFCGNVTNCRRTKSVCELLWQPGQSFIFAGFALSLPGLANNKADPSCGPELAPNCVDHSADLSPCAI